MVLVHCASCQSVSLTAERSPPPICLHSRSRQEFFVDVDPREKLLLEMHGGGLRPREVGVCAYKRCKIFGSKRFGSNEKERKKNVNRANLKFRFQAVESRRQRTANPCAVMS